MVCHQLRILVSQAVLSDLGQNLTKMPSHVEHTMETMMFKFHKLAEDIGCLTKEDLRVFTEKEFPEIFENLAVDKIMKDLNQCQNGRLGF